MSEASGCVRWEKRDGIARLVLDRADRRNALTRSMIEEMTGHLTAEIEAANGSDAVRLMKIVATGSVFCAGMDLAEMQDRSSGDNGPQEWLQDALRYRDLLQAILDAPFPVLAVVQGPVLAGGVGLVLACDLVLAVSTTFLALPEPQRGITAAMVTPLLIHRVGAGHANQALLSGQRLATQDTAGWGWCHEVVEPEELSSAEARWTQSIMTGSPQALAATKQNIRAIGGADLKQQLSLAAHQSAEARATADAREGLHAFLEKRLPAWHPGETDPT